MTSRTEGDGWSGRLEGVAALLHVDALAIVLVSGGGPSTYAAHGLHAVAWPRTTAAATIVEVLAQRVPAQLSGPDIRLADGRTADALAAAPIVWKDQLVGALVALAARPLSSDDVALLADAAGLVAIDLAEANVSYRAVRQAQDAEARIRVLRELQRSVRERDLDALLERATDRIAELYAADGVSIMLIGDDGTLAVRSARGLSEAVKDGRGRLGEGIAGKVAQSGEPRLIVGAAADGTDASATEAMVVPLRTPDRVVGVVSVKRRASQHRFGQSHIDALSSIADAIANAIALVNEVERAEADRQQALVLYELARFASLGADPASDLASAAAMLAGTLRHDAVAVWQIEKDTLRRRASSGYDASSAQIALEDADIALATVVREKQVVREKVALADARPAWAPSGCADFVLAPVGSRGVLVCGRGGTNGYDREESDFTATVGDFLVGMLERCSPQDTADGVATERRRIAQEMHDGLAQELTGVVLALEGCQRALEKDPSLVKKQLQKAARAARATLADVRQYMAALRQSETGALNLPATLGRLVEDLRRQTGLQVEMDENGPQRELEPVVERAVIRIVGEALRNVAQHAGAARAKVALEYGSEAIVVTIEDDGRGFDVDHAFTSAEAGGHFGIVGMRERAEAAGGELVVRSADGHGAMVRASIPYASAAAAVLAGTLEDAERASVDEQDAGERGSFFTRLFGR